MKRILLGLAGLAVAGSITAQTFSEGAAGFGLDVVATKDGGHAFADFNEDGFPDVVVNTDDPAVGSVLLFSNGLGGYTDVTDTHANALNATVKERSAVVGDFNGDGHMDFVVNSFNRMEVWLNGGPSATPAYSFGTAIQAPNQTISSLPGGMNAEGVVTIDYDNDGDLDLIYDSHAFGIDCLSNNGAGQFSLVPNNQTGLPNGGGAGDYAAAGDYDNDGYVDLLLRRDVQFGLYHNNGDGTFSRDQNFTQTGANSNKGSVLFADFDNDGDLDIFWTDAGTNEIWRNDGTTWTATGLPTISGTTVPNGVDGVTAGDVDNDGDIDLFLGTNVGAGYLFINDDPSTLSFTRNNLGINLNANSEGVSFVDIDADGDLDLYANISSTTQGNQLWVNDLNNTNYLVVNPRWGSSGESLANGATAELLDCSGNRLSGLRNVGAGQGHGCFGAIQLHFGLDATQTYFVRVSFPYANGTRAVVTKQVTPNTLANQSLTIYSTDASDAIGCPGVPIAVNDSFDVVSGDLLSDNVGTNDSDASGDPLVYNLVDAGTAGANGTLVFNPDGSFTFTTTNQGPLTYTFIYELCNNTNCAQATVTINVLSSNVAPVAVDDTASGNEDTDILGDVSTNDSDANGDALTYTLLTNPAHGSVTLGANGSFTYTPDLNYNGADSFTYEVCDIYNACASATVNITVDPVNDAPTAIDDTYNTAYNTSVNDNVLGNDVDVDGDVLIVGANTNTANGNVTIAADGSFTYIPNFGFFGVDTFTYDACDGQVCTTATVTIDVAFGNLPPVAVDDNFTTLEETNLTGDVSGNDSDPENQPLTFNLVNDVAFGTLTFNNDGTFDYTPSVDFFGTDAFTYEACDGFDCTTATVTIDVTNVNDAPVANDDFYNVAAFFSYTANVLDNDIDADGDILSIGANTLPTNGTLVIDVDGNFTYTPDLNFLGLDSFTYEACDGVVCTTATVTLNVVLGNIAPTVQDETYTIDEDNNLLGDVSTNDFDPNGDILTYNVTLLPSNGTVTLNADGTFEYQPDANFNGSDMFMYDACDAEFCSSGTVQITVNPINDDPTALNDNVTTTVDTPVGGNVLTNDFDVDGDALTIGSYLSGSFGDVVMDLDGTFTYTPNAGFTGADFFSYEACDGSGACATAIVVVQVDAIVVNDPPVAIDDVYFVNEDDVLTANVGDNDSDPNGDVLTFNLLFDVANGTLVLNSDGSFTYTPNANFNGGDGFVYEACDSEVCTTALVTINIDPTNDAPVANDDAYTLDVNTSLTDNVIANDTDIDGDVLFIGGNTNPTNGTLSIDLDGTFTYTPDTDFTGTDSFTYDVCDGFGPCATATVTITVNGVNDAPVALDDVYTMNEDDVLTANVGDNDSDPNGDVLTFNLLFDVANGTLVLNSDGSFTYTPNANFNGGDGFVYEACDNQVCTTALVTINIDPVNDATVANDDAYTLDVNTSVTDNVIANDTDIDGDILFIGGNTNPTNGTLTIDIDGTFTYTPDTDFTGTDSFTYDVCDGVGPCATATVTFTVNAIVVNDPPVVTDESYSMQEDEVLTDNVSTNDSDPNNDVLTYNLVNDVFNGTLVLNADGSFTYTPVANFNGLDGFTYEACDGEFCVQGFASIRILPVQDAPIVSDDAYTTTINTDVVDNVLTNDAEVDGEILFVGANTLPINGTLVINADGSFTYTPNTDFIGTDSFTYDACDGIDCVTATVTITVNDLNIAPVAVDDNYTMDEDGVLNANVGDNDSDPNGDVLSFNLISSTANGTLVFNADGSFTYTPDANFNGGDGFVYEACDNQVCTTALVIININPVNDEPTGADDAYTMNENTSLTDNVLVNDSDIDGDVLFVGANTDPANGTLVIDIDGTFTYTPNADFVGTDGFTYDVCDGFGPCATVTVTIDVQGVNTPPMAEDDLFSTDEDTSLDASVATNDSDGENDPLTFNLLTDVSNGTLVFNTDGSFTYTPNADFNGTDSFTYEVCDAEFCATAGVTIEVLPVNDAPVGNDDSYTTALDIPITDNVLANDTDVDGDVLTVCGNTDPSNGIVSIDVDGTFTYQPNTGFVGTDSFTYDVCDGTATVTSIVVTIDITDVNVAPIAEDDTFSTDEDTALDASVAPNDSDPNGDVLTYSIVSDPQFGTVTMNADGTFTYTPNADFNGTDSFTYEACDAEFCTEAGVTIDVLPVNDAPVGNDDVYFTGIDIPITDNVLANDTDVDGDQLTICGNTSTSNGTVSIDVDGTFTYIPNTGYEGSDSFTYDVCDGTAAPITVTVTINITGENVAPIAVDDLFSTDEDVVLDATVAANDSDLNGDVLTYTIVTDPQFGTVVMNSDGTFTYTPDANFNGTDFFTYQACDAEFCTEAGVQIDVLPANDAPVGVEDNYSTGIDVPITENVLANDSDLDLDQLFICGNTNPSNGIVSIDVDGTFTYIPNSGYEGSDSFTYDVCDGTAAPITVTVNINVIGEDLPPVAEDDFFTTNEDTPLSASVGSNDFDPNGSPLTFQLLTDVQNGTLVLNADGSFTYTPNQDWFGTDTFIYQACDGTFCTEAGVTIEVLPVNDAPVGRDDFYVTLEGDPITENVLANDTDVDEDQLTVTSNTSTSNGTVSIDPDGTFTYIPNPGYFGPDSFTYTACDPSGACVTVTVFINVVDVNLPPVAVDDNYTVNEDSQITMTVTSNDNDPEGDVLVVTLISGTANGTLVLNGNGTFTYTPSSNFNGTDSFVYQICDSFGLCDQATVTITVTPVLDLAIANNDTYTTNEDVVLNDNVSSNDLNVDNLTLTYTVVTDVQNGTLVLNANGSFTYTPDANFNGTDSFVYQLCDDNNNCDQATVTITVVPVNDAPIAVDDTYTIDEDTTLSGDVSTNDSDVEGSALTFSISTNPANGSVVVNVDGTFTYTPNANFNGTDTFDYEVCDASGACSIGTVTINVLPIDDPVVAVDDNYTVVEEGVLNANVGTNDVDVDNDQLTFTLVQDVANGTLVLNADGTFTYTPNANFSGTDTFQYQVCDQNDNCDIARVTIEVTPVNDAPIAVDDAFVTDEDTALSADASTNDSDVDSPNLTYTVVTNPISGTLVLNADGTFDYTPNANFNGLDSFLYSVCDDQGACDTARVTINVLPINDAPDAIDDEFTTVINTVLNQNVVTNDVDVDNDALTVTLVTNVTNGTLVLNSDGTFTYTPNTDFLGDDSFVYEACDPSGLCDQATVIIHVVLGDLPPVAVDDAFTTDEDVVLNATVATNDSDPNGGTLTYTVVTDVANGTLVLNADGSFTYTPDADFNGTDTFTYQVCDATNLCDEATVTITVVPVNDAPVAVDDTYTTDENVAVSGNVTDNDSDVDSNTLTVTLVTNVTNGTLVLNADGTFTYTPNTGFIGTDSFTYSICDDQGACDEAVVTITVNEVVEPALVLDDTYGVPEDTQLSADVSANDAPDLTYTLLDNVTNGTLVFNADGTFTYNPNANYNGPDSFTYIGCTVSNVCDTALVTINVNPVDDSPIDQGEQLNLCQGTDVPVIAVLDNASDVEGDPLTVTIQSITNGTATVNVDGTISYVANDNFFGTVVITYLVCDGGSTTVCATSQVTINVVANAFTVNATTDNLACFVGDDGSVVLDVTGGFGPYTFDWSNDSTGTQITGVGVGTYTVTITDQGGCAAPFNASYTLTSPAELVVDVDLDYDPCLDKTGNVTLNVAGGTPDYIYIWDNINGNSATQSNLSPGVYSVTIGDANGCTITEEIVLEVGSPDCFSVPSGFSPDGNGRNDLFVISGIGLYPGNKVTIFNRWGNKVYEKTDYQNDWDGSANAPGFIPGEKVQPGTYFYVIDLNNGKDPVNGYLIIKY